MALVAMALAMLFSAASERRAATRAADDTASASRVLAALLDMETGMRGFLLTRDPVFLEPYNNGRTELEQAERAVRKAAGGDRQTLALMDRHQRLEQRWEAAAAHEIAVAQERPGYRLAIAGALQRKALMDRLRAVNAALQTRLVQRRNAALHRAGLQAALFVLALTALLGGLAWALLSREGRRRRRDYQRELDHRTRQRQFTDVIQVVHSEPEAHRLLKRHLELSIPQARATVLSRNNSESRLEPTTEVDEGSPLAEGLVGAAPSSCLAIRLARRHDEDGTEQLLSCEVCGRSAGRSACQPLLVGGEVIGSVLVEHDGTLDEEAERPLTESIAQAAPVLANLRNLALAERRASTDALTGLPNRRALQDALKRMAAQASRSVTPLAAIAIDLDRFKDVNDRFGHEMGDTVLAHVGTLLRASVRTSDVVARLGGEEFMILAPDTGAAGAEALAEKIRSTLERTPVPGLDRDTTASFGVAVLPDHATSDDALVRLADRALYEAKRRGRNRVEVAGDAPVAEGV